MPAADDIEHPRIAALRAEIAELEEELAATARPRTRASLEAELARLRAELAGPEAGPGPASPQPTLHADQSGQSGGVSAGAGNRFEGDVFFGDVTQIIQSVGEERAADVLFTSYLRSLAGVCNRLSFADADSSDPTRAAIELAAIFTGLEVGRTVQEKRGGREQTRQLLALEVIARQRRLVLLGPPGSGKSTIANYLGLRLAQARLAGPAARPVDLGPAWPEGAFVPIRIVLRELAAWIGGRQGHGSAELLWTFLGAEKRFPPALIDRLRGEVAAGRALLLLDGLDEVPAGDSGALLHTMQQLIRDIAAVAGSSRILVTCRELDYRAPRRQIPGWPEETIIALSPELRRQFIEKWFAVLAQLGRPMNGDPAELRARLISEVQFRPEIRRLAGNPLLLTMMTHVHAHEGELPNQRVRLYEKSIDFLLRRWRPDQGEQPLRELLRLDSWSDSDLHTLLDHLGFAAHEHGVGADGEAGSDLPEELLIKTAKLYFSAEGEGAYRRADDFAGYISRYSNGVIQRFGPELYRFPHRTFQEYLAARRLVANSGWADDEAEATFSQRALRRADAGPQWREVLLLAAGQLAVVNKDVSPALDLLHTLITRRPGVSAERAHDLALAGELLAEIGRPLLRRQSALADGLWEQARAGLTTLLGSLDTHGAAPVGTAERLRAGQALGLLGDQRSPVSDEEWRAALTGLATSFTAAGEHYWRYLPAGRYRIGGWQKGQPSAEHDLAAFWVARLPVTVAQFARFVDAGYRDDSCWTPNGLAWREGRSEPYRWGTPQYSGANQPVVYITWYEATAFCSWLSAQVQAALPVGYALRLPTEAEWEAAAAFAGPEMRRPYPWGEPEPVPERAVYDAWKLNAPAPVGLCPAGAAACGALDMAGNVLEWCASHFDIYPDTAYTLEKDFTKGDFEVPVRGGAYYLNSTNVRCGARLWFHPDDYLDSARGFRVVLAPPIAQMS